MCAERFKFFRNTITVKLVQFIIYFEAYAKIIPINRALEPFYRSALIRKDTT